MKKYERPKYEEYFSSLEVGETVEILDGEIPVRAVITDMGIAGGLGYIIAETKDNIFKIFVETVIPNIRKVLR